MDDKTKIKNLVKLIAISDKKIDIASHKVCDALGLEEQGYMFAGWDLFGAVLTILGVPPEGDPKEDGNCMIRDWYYDQFEKWKNEEIDFDTFFEEITKER